MNFSNFFIIFMVIAISSFIIFEVIYFKSLPKGNFNQVQQLPFKVENITKKEEPIFKPENLLWENITQSAPWKPRDSGASFVFQNKLWLLGGLNANGKVGKNHRVNYSRAPHFNDIWNTEDGINWFQVSTSSVWESRRSMSVVAFNNKLWMFGGWSPITGYTNDVWISEDGIHWLQIVKEANWPAREGQTSVVFKNKIWLIGGVNYNKRQVKNDVWYSDDGINWIEVKNIPWKPRWDHAIAIFKDKLFLTGGMNLAGETFSDVWMTEDGFSWKLLTANPPWQARQGHNLLVYKNKLWLIGRLNDIESGGSNDVWFSDDGINWQKTVNDPPWNGREDFSAIVFKDRIWVFGGMDFNWQWLNDVWASYFKE
jgi:hypothetical protein